MYKKPCLLIYILVCFSLLIGCAPKRYFSGYEFRSAIAGSPQMDRNVSVQVMPGGDILEPGQRNGWVWGLIPLMPCGWQRIQQAERFLNGFEGEQYRLYDDWNRSKDKEKRPAKLREGYVPYNLVGELSEVIQGELDSAKLFREVRYVSDDKYCSAKPGVPAAEEYKHELLLLVEVREMTWSRYPTFYGFSMLGAAGWLLGLPVSYGNCKMVVALEAVWVGPGEDEEETLWEKEYASEVDCTEWLYSNWGATESWCRALKSIMNGVCSDILKEMPRMEKNIRRLEQGLEIEE